ncbi:MAG: FAD-binding protein [Thermodesulfobacteriota bacterium]
MAKEREVSVIQKTIEADVLCVGGGIAGLMAAIRARELGAKVVLAEKANTLRSGSAGTGCDHFRCYIPEFHGPDIDPVVEEVWHSQVGWTRPREFVATWMERSFEIVKLWDSWGIPMRYKGRWEFAGHAIPGRPFTTLKYSGQNLKPTLTREAQKRGVKIVNRVMVFDLIRDGGIIGAVGVDTRGDRAVTFLAGSVVLGTGGCVRLYPGPTPGWMFNRADSPHTTGDGRAMAYRAGAELVNMEIPMRWAGPKYFARCGKATWVGVLRDPQGKPVGPFVTRPDRRYGDAVSDAYKNLFEDYTRSGKGPVYMDCRGMSAEDYRYMMYWMIHEGNTGLLGHMKEEGIDIRRDPIEFMTYEMTTRGGIHYNHKGETSLRGLYAAGDEYFGGASCAATFGRIAGENAALHAGAVDAPDRKRVWAAGKEKDLFDAIRGRETGETWQEVNVAVNQTLADYAGPVRYENLLKAGAAHLRRLKKRAYGNLMARNQHELMHCLEVLNLLDLGEIIFAAVRKRSETRDKVSRLDYPFTNPVFDGKMLVCKKRGERPVVEWRVVKP